MSLPVLALVLSLLSIAAFYVYLLTRHTVLALLSLFAVSVFDFGFGLSAHTVGPFHLSAYDVISICLLLAAAIRFFAHLRSFQASRLFVLGYLLVFAWSVARGMQVNGVLAAGNEARGFVGPLLGMLYFAEAPCDGQIQRQIVFAFLGFSAVLCGIAVLASCGLPVGLAASAGSAVAAMDNRVLPSGAAAIVALGGFLALAYSAYQNSGILSRTLPFFFLLVALDLRHRTVWGMLIVGTAALMVFDRRLFRRLVPAAAFSLAAVCGMALYGSISSRSATGRDFENALSNTGTWEWRVNGWQGFLHDPDQSPSSILLGRPMGSGWWRIDPVSHAFQGAPPHSEYVTEFLRVGVLGLVCVLGFVFVALARLRRISNESEFPSASIWSVVVWMALAYGITYSLDAECFALLGAASAIAFGSIAEIRLDESVEEKPFGDRSAYETVGATGEMI